MNQKIIEILFLNGCFDLKDILFISKYYHSYFLYEIRGDKSNTSDGIFKKEELISKVVNVIPNYNFAEQVGNAIYYSQEINGGVNHFNNYYCSTYNWKDCI